jgi:hypothetical protein
MRSSLLASVQLKVFHATGPCARSDLTEVKYNIRRLSGDDKEEVLAQLQSLQKYVVHMLMTIKF